MKKFLILGIVVFTLAACNGKSKNEDFREDINSIAIDTVTVNKIQRSDDTTKTSPSKDVKEINNKKATRQHSSSSSYKLKVNNDNMRGFDPPSEDDMDDNGMSRYMENNDEEGWY